ncbi:HET-domain-containing protein [Lophiostoma macrostomum CBS 122681]|uniref:HET-domain-containing protein n=1 Tax=Lophiostoma macrostomum CBS 122681 TaxID=1314788 RepID=A0A6A6TTZ0_9PLEO|nr:HET-domain-containing protein [Lophiostoma macrostomum CBS 122681]
MTEEQVNAGDRPLLSTYESRNSVGCLKGLISSLSGCIKGHAKCWEAFDSSWVPTRLIDISEYKSIGKACLVSRDQIVAALSSERDLRYTSLSHVWGSHKFLSLNTCNETGLSSGFPVSRLPETFQQAVYVTDSIGLRYLWIDSLCILQDSVEDWKSEASLMGKVYLNSFCTLAASLATRPTEGLFWDRHPELANAFPVEFSHAHGYKRFAVFYDLQDLILERSALHKRGWVLQESYLSPRTIHFTKFPAFECREMFACENYRTAGTEDNAVTFRWLRHTSKTISRTEVFTYSDWFNIVYDYSRCSLTFITDKLIALCGIAQAVSRSPAIGNEYHAGVWKYWWLQGLLWMVDQSSLGYEMYPIRYHQTYIAPSWSWASVEAAIQPWGPRNIISQTFVELQGISTVPINGDPFGQLSGGEIRFKDRLFALSQFRQLAEADRSELAAYAFSLDDGLVPDDVSLDDCDGDWTDDQTFFLPLVESPDYSTWHSECSVCGLLLQFHWRGLETRRVFQRVGFAVISKADGNVAGSGYHIDEWAAPPWREEDLEVIISV